MKLRFVCLPLLLVLCFAINVLAGTTATNLQQTHGWQSCTVPCAGGLGNAVYSTAGPVSSPSMDGIATQFKISGPTPYSNALWWKNVAPNDNAHNFVYDLWFYVTDPTKPQSLEFDVNQSIAGLGKWFVFGTQCDFKDSHMWDIWDGTHEKWQPTQVPCPLVSAFAWHHLILEFQRTSAGTSLFVSVTLDGRKSYFNRSFGTRQASSSAVNVAFQMDGDYKQEPYSVWIDKMTLTYW